MNNLQEKAKKSLLDMRAKLERIADLALAADAKCGTCDKIGQNWMTCSKALCEIRDLCGPSILEKARGESAAEEIFSTLGMAELPAKVIPHDEPAAEVPRTEAEKQGTCSYFSLGNGAFPIRRANTESGTMEHVWIDGRRFTMEVVVAEKVDGITKECEFDIRDNGQIKLEAHYYGGKSNAAKIAHKALKTYIKQLTGASKFHSRGGFLKQALKRLTEQRGKDSAAPVEEEANRE